MSRYVVVVNKPSVVESAVGDGEVVDTKKLGGDENVFVVKFEDEAAGSAFSQELNGTVFRAEWAARENARHRATSST